LIQCAFIVPQIQASEASKKRHGLSPILADV